MPRMMSNMLPSHDPRHLLRMPLTDFRRSCAGTSAALPVSILAISRVLSRLRLRHFPRESLIARLASGEASIVIGGTRGRQGESYLDDAQRAIQSQGDSRGAEGIPGADADWTRIVRGQDTTKDMDWQPFNFGDVRPANFRWRTFVWHRQRTDGGGGRGR